MDKILGKLDHGGSLFLFCGYPLRLEGIILLTNYKWDKCYYLPLFIKKDGSFESWSILKFIYVWNKIISLIIFLSALFIYEYFQDFLGASFIS